MTIDDVRARLAEGVGCVRPTCDGDDLSALLDDHARLTKERDFYRGERDAAREEAQRLRAQWQSSPVSLRTGTLVAEVERLTRERDTALGALAEVRAAYASHGAAGVSAALAASPTDLSTAYRRRVAAEALREAAKEAGRAAQEAHQLQVGGWETVFRERSEWLRTLANRVRGESKMKPKRSLEDLADEASACIEDNGLRGRDLRDYLTSWIEECARDGDLDAAKVVPLRGRRDR